MKEIRENQDKKKIEKVESAAHINVNQEPSSSRLADDAGCSVTY